MKTKKFNVYIVVKTGLHIWAWNENIWIGEMDNPIIKDKNWFPYIPASSLKWKLRSLYELKGNKIWPNWWPYEFNQDAEKDEKWKVKNPIYDEISMFFWKAGKNTDWLENLWPTRFIFRDLKLVKYDDLKKQIESNDREDENDKNDKLKKYIKSLWLESFEKDDLYTFEDYEKWQQEWQALTEEKTEVAINRKTWTAWSWQFSPRPVERVFAWTVFKWELVVRLFEKKEILKQWTNRINTDDENKKLDYEKIKKILWQEFNKFVSEEEIMKYCFWDKYNDSLVEFGFLKGLLENDYLGWMWTRGSGQVEIIFEEVK